jgi:hypothetical protein
LQRVTCSLERSRLRTEAIGKAILLRFPFSQGGEWVSNAALKIRNAVLARRRLAKPKLKRRGMIRGDDGSSFRYGIVLGSDGWSVWDHVAGVQAPASIRLSRSEAEWLCEYLNSSLVERGRASSANYTTEGSAELAIISSKE